MPLSYVFGRWGFEIVVNTVCIGFLGNGVLSRACSYALSPQQIKLHLDKAIRLWHLVCVGRLAILEKWAMKYHINGSPSRLVIYFFHAENRTFFRLAPNYKPYSWY